MSRERIVNSECFETVFEAVIVAIEVIGRPGRNLGKWWRENRFQAYQGSSTRSNIRCDTWIGRSARSSAGAQPTVPRRGRTTSTPAFKPSGEATLLRPTSTRNAVREASTFPLRDYTIAQCGRAVAAVSAG